MNPRYISYAKAHGKTPMEMMRFDEIRWSGGCMTGFILWISKSCAKFKKEHPEYFIGPHIGNQEAWTKYLETFK